jgi:thermostable 8-oxoguanine DNA glycosylase
MRVTAHWSDADLARVRELIGQFGPRLRAAADPVLHSQTFLRDNGFRMWEKRGRWIAANFARFVEGDRCLLLERTAPDLVRARAGTPLTPAEMLEVERRAVYALCEGQWKAAGVGPKQARHILKGVGLAAWTIPLDSRLMRFLWEVAESPDHALPWLPALGDEYTFRMVENWFCDLAAGVGITPVELDTLLWEAYESGSRLVSTNSRGTVEARGC